MAKPTELTERDWNVIKGALSMNLKAHERQAKGASQDVIRQAHEKFADELRSVLVKI